MSRDPHRLSDRSVSPTEPGPAPPGARLYRLAWIVYLVMAIAGVVWMGLREGEISLAQFLDLETYWTDVGLGLAVGLGLLALWEIGRRFLRSARELEDAFGQLLAGLEPSDTVGLALLSGFAEELFFRGAVQGSIGLLWATFLFALVHTGPGRAFRLWTLFALVAGLALGFLVEERGVLLPAIVAHALVNGVSLTRLARRGPAGSAGPSGPIDAP